MISLNGTTEQSVVQLLFFSGFNIGPANY